MATTTEKRRKKFHVTGKSTPAKEKLFVEKGSELRMMAPPPEQDLAASPYDLTTLQNVKDFLNMEGDSDDNLLQGMITAFGMAFLWETGFNNQDGTLSSG